MNIKNRLKKLESELNTIESDEFCQCFKKHLDAQINQAYGEPYNEKDLLPDDTEITDFCQRCKKPVHESIKQFYYDIELCYREGATKDEH